MRLGLALLTLSVLACGSFGTTTSTDGGVDAEAPPAPLDPCRSKPFRAPEKLQVPTNWPSDVGVTAFRHVTDTEVYAAGSDGVLRSYSVNAEESPTTLATNVLLAPGAEKMNHPHVFDGGKRLVFEAKPVTGGNERLFFASRTTDIAPWGSLLDDDRVPGAIEGEPWVVDNRKIYFVVADGKDDIYTLERKDEVWGLMKPVAELNTAGDEAYPVVTDDDLEIFFLSRTTPGANQGEMFTSKRQARRDLFPSPTRVVELSMADGDDRPSWISKNGCTIVMTRKIGDLYSLWRSTR